MRKLSILFFILIFFISFYLGAQTWSILTRLTWNSGNSHAPSIAIDENNGVHICWQDTSPGNQEILFKNSTDSGVNWGPQTRLSWNPTLSDWPSITAASSGVHVAWSNYASTNFEIF